MIKLKDILLEKEQVVQPEEENILQLKKLRIIFGSDSTSQQKIARKFEKLKLVTKSFTSVLDAIRYVEDLIEKGVNNLEEVVIGSHGTNTGLRLVKSASGDETEVDKFEGDDKVYKYDEALLKAITPLINPSTKVFFTACYGADQLRSLVHAANILGVTVYGAAGVSAPGLNRILQKFSNKIFKCKPSNSEANNEHYMTQKICEHSKTPIKWLRVKA